MMTRGEVIDRKGNSFLANSLWLFTGLILISFHVIFQKKKKKHKTLIK